MTVEYEYTDDPVLLAAVVRAESPFEHVEEETGSIPEVWRRTGMVRPESYQNAMGEGVRFRIVRQPIEAYLEALGVLFQVADDIECQTLHELADRAGWLWPCECGWYNEATRTGCDDCSRYREDED